MTREQLFRLLRREAREAKVEFRIEKSEGKGSHYRVYFGAHRTIVQSGELTPIMVMRIRRQLGLR